MDIGVPTNVRHVAHVTYDRFNGFLGLPVEFETDVPNIAPSASTSAFGVSTESMQLSVDSTGNCVPTILMLMQRHLYAQGGLREEGIFRITADNDQEELLRGQVNGGIIPDDIDVHCLAGLIKAWFRELPTRVLDPLEPEDVTQCKSEEDCSKLVRQLPSTESALLDWAINLMADVVQEQQYNKMNAHNIAMVFAPNMTQMADPVTALMYAVEVMNFLKNLITKKLRRREHDRINPRPASCAGPSDGSGQQSQSELDEYTKGSDPEQYSSEDGNESDDSPFHLHSFKGPQPSLKIGSGPTSQSFTSNARKDPAGLGPTSQSCTSNARKDPAGSGPTSQSCTSNARKDPVGSGPTSQSCTSNARKDPVGSGVTSQSCTSTTRKDPASSDGRPPVASTEKPMSTNNPGYERLERIESLN